MTVVYKDTDELSNLFTFLKVVIDFDSEHDIKVNTKVQGVPQSQTTANR